MLTIPEPKASIFIRFAGNHDGRLDWLFLFQVSWLGLGERKNDLEKAPPV